MLEENTNLLTLLVTMGIPAAVIKLIAGDRFALLTIAVIVPVMPMK
jgi:hypothetical protein